MLSTILEDYNEAERVLRFGLVANPGDRLLTNNLAFVLISLGRLAEAQSLLDRMDPRAAEDLSTITLIATRGMVLFRKGLVEVGRNLYLDAIDIAKRKSNPRFAALAALHLAVEEIRADTDTKLESFRNARELASQVDEPDVKHVYARLTKLAEQAKLTVD